MSKNAPAQPPGPEVKEEHEADGLEGHLADVVVLDCTVHLMPDPATTYIVKPAREDFERERVPAARGIVRAAFAAVGAMDRPVIAYCGGGIAASADAMILMMLGHQDVKIYDASLSEWAKDEALPMEVGDRLGQNFASTARACSSRQTLAWTIACGAVRSMARSRSST